MPVVKCTESFFVMKDEADTLRRLSMVEKDLGDILIMKDCYSKEDIQSAIKGKFVKKHEDKPDPFLVKIIKEAKETDTGEPIKKRRTKEEILKDLAQEHEEKGKRKRRTKEEMKAAKASKPKCKRIRRTKAQLLADGYYDKKS